MIFTKKKRTTIDLNSSKMAFETQLLLFNDARGK